MVVMYMALLVQRPQASNLWQGMPLPCERAGQRTSFLSRIEMQGRACVFAPQVRFRHQAGIRTHDTAMAHDSNGMPSAAAG